MVALKGKPDIGDQVNKKIIAPLTRIDQAQDAKVAAEQSGTALRAELNQTRSDVSCERPAELALGG